IIDAGTAQDAAHENVEVKMGRHGEAAAVFQQRVEKTFLVENGIARVGIGKESRDAVRVASFAAEVRDDEIDVRRRELHPTIRLNHLHRGFLICRLFVEQFKFHEYGARDSNPAGPEDQYAELEFRAPMMQLCHAVQECTRKLKLRFSNAVRARKRSIGVSCSSARALKA